MSRKLRFIPPSALVEVTCRTFQGRMLLRPSPELRKVIVGILAKAQRKYDVEIHAYCFMSNHYHMILTPKDARALSRFMCFFQSKLAREVCRLHDWSEKVWGGRYRHTIVSREPAAQEARIRYLLSQGCKEGLVSHPGRWPGAQSVSALSHGKRRRGVYTNRSREYRLRQRGLDPTPDQYCEELELLLSPLPVWADLPPVARRRRCREIVAQIVEETRQRHIADGTRPLGVRRICGTRPHARRSLAERRPAPLIHAASRQVRRAFGEVHKLFVSAFREASERLRTGQSNAVFPEGSFPPAGSFVPWTVEA